MWDFGILGFWQVGTWLGIQGILITGRMALLGKMPIIIPWTTLQCFIYIIYICYLLFVILGFFGVLGSMFAGYTVMLSVLGHEHSVKLIEGAKLIKLIILVLALLHLEELGRLSAGDG